jgi:hypothetical protein
VAGGAQCLLTSALICEDGVSGGLQGRFEFVEDFITTRFD